MGEEIEEVMIVFEQPEPQEIRAAGIGKIPTIEVEDVGKVAKSFRATMGKIEEWFRKFKVDKIEIWIKAAVESGKVLNLFVSAKGEGGLKVTLTPR